MATGTNVEQRKKDHERNLLSAFFEDFTGTTNAWALLAERERPDFVVDYEGRRLGIEVTELLARDTGRERAGERSIATVIADVVGQFVEEHDGCGASVDGYLRNLPRRRDEADGLPVQLMEHLRRYGAALAKPGGLMTLPFTFSWGAITRIQRQDTLGSIRVFAERMRHRTTSTDRERPWLEEQLIAAIEEKTHKAATYDRTHPLWLVVRNPYTHLPDISVEARRAIAMLNADGFDAIYCHNWKMNVADPDPPRPRVVLLHGRRR